MEISFHMSLCFSVEETKNFLYWNYRRFFRKNDPKLGWC